MSDPVDLIESEPLLNIGYLRLTKDTFRLNGAEVQRAVVWHPGAVALVVEDADGRWLMVEQYRHPAGRVLLEIPAGTREVGEAPEVTAAREVREETGYAAGRLVRLGGAWMAPGFCSEYIDYFLATDLTESPLPQDEDEFIAPPRRLTLAEVQAGVASGEIEDSKTLIALALLSAHRSRHG